MQDNFTKGMDFLMPTEGGWSNKVNDHGGATNHGVTQSVYDTYRDIKKLSQQSVSLMSNVEMLDLYKTFYWDKCKCDQLPDKIDIVIFDTSVNSGCGEAGILLQRALGFPKNQIDGIIGSGTIQAANQTNITLEAVLLQERRDFYKEIVEKDSSQSIFLNGWENRINNLYNFLNKF